MSMLSDLIARTVGSGGGGGSVTSVNGRTGAVVLDAEDVGAEPKKFVVTVTGDGQGNLSADKTFAQISSALQDEKEVVVKYFKNFGDTMMYFAADLGGMAYVFTAPLMLINQQEVEYNKWQLVVFRQNDTDTWLDYSELFAPVPRRYAPGSGAVSIEPENNCVYSCGTLTSLTITNPPAAGAYSIVFTSGSTATTTTIPATVLGLESFAPEANTLYEINVLDNRAVVGSWAVSA